jgi:hypothetical protein
VADDPIVAEVRKHRCEIARECGNDLRRIFEHFRDRQKEGGREVVDRSKDRERIEPAPGGSRA